MEGIVIYGSRYGSAKTYAEALAQRTGFELRPYQSVGELDEYDAIAYVGAIYAGSVTGMKATLSKLADGKAAGKRIAIATVGLTDTDDPDTVKRIEAGMRSQLPEDVIEAASLYHLRGAIDYTKLGLGHRAMMWLLRRTARKMDESERSSEMQAVMDSYGKSVSYVNTDLVAQIADELTA